MAAWRQFLAVLYDALLEHRDRKINYFLLALTAFTVLTLASLEFGVATPRETVNAWCTILPSVGTSYLPGFYLPHPAMPSAGPVRSCPLSGGGEQWSFSLRYTYPQAIGWAMEMWAASDRGRDLKAAEQVARRHFNHLLVHRAIDVLGQAKARFPDTAGATQEVIDRLAPLAEHWVAADKPAVPTAPADEEHYLAERWESFGFAGAQASRTGEGMFDLSFTVPRPLEAVHVKSVRVLWLYTFDVREDFSYARVLGAIRAGLVRGTAGTDHFFYMGFGVLAALFVTGGSLSAVLARGAVELTIAKPLSRTLFLLSRYASAVLFVLCHAALFFGGTGLALWANTGFWDGRFLAAGIALAAGIFAVIYAVSVLVAVLARSAAFVPIFSMGILLVCGQLAELYRFGLLTLREDIPLFLQRGAKILYWILPKTVDLLGHGTSMMVSPGMSEKLVKKLDLVPMVLSISAPAALATTAAFVAAVLGLACWLFSRKEP